MKIAAALAWYDELPEHLDRCVRSLAGVCDVLVAADGAWEPFPDAEAASEPEQVEAIGEAGRAVDIDTAIIQRPHVWASQAEKRTRLMQFCSLEEEADWILVIDADEFVTDCDPWLLRDALALTRRDVAQVAIEQPDTSRRAIRRIYRAHPELAVVGAHNGYCVQERDWTRWLNRDEFAGKVASALELSDALVLGHDQAGRTASRQRRSRLHYLARAEAGGS